MGFDLQNVADRRTSPTTAKQARLQRFETRPNGDETLWVRRGAERQAEKTAGLADTERLPAAERERIARPSRREGRVRHAPRRAELSWVGVERPRNAPLETVRSLQERAARE